MSKSLRFGVWEHFGFEINYDADGERVLEHYNIRNLSDSSVSVFKSRQKHEAAHACMHARAHKDTQNKLSAAFLVYSIQVKEITMTIGKSIYGSAEHRLQKTRLGLQSRG